MAAIDTKTMRRAVMAMEIDEIRARSVECAVLIIANDPTRFPGTVLALAEKVIEAAKKIEEYIKA